jgi:hypothetical protein
MCSGVAYLLAGIDRTKVIIRARASGSHGLPAALHPWWLENIGCNIGSSEGNTAMLGKTAMNADTSDAVLTLLININGRRSQDNGRNLAG